MHVRPRQLAPTSFMGREQEVGAILHTMRSEDVRLVTLVGPPGVGKTRLAFEASRRLGEFRIYSVDLSPIRDPALVPAAIAQALGVMESPDRPIFRRLLDYLQGRDLLLILDNFEQVVEAAPQISELVEICPALKIIATSREPLHLTREREIQVNPLALPDPQDLGGPDRLVNNPAIALFGARARSVQPTFTLTDQNSQPVAEICRILDGLPLAIEMAAAQAKFMPPQLILSRLQSHLTELATGLRDVPDRHRTLGNAISWSYELLTPSEQSLFRHLAVFVGGCTLEAAEAVCAGDALLATEVVAGIASLVDKSLLRHEANSAGMSRFRQLQTLQDFGLEALRRLDELPHVRRRHAIYYVDLAERAARYLRRRAEQAEWLDRLESDHDNFRTALAWSQTAPDPETELRLAGSLEWFWFVRGHWSEGRRHLAHALRVANMPRSHEFAQALWGAANLACFQGDLTHSASLGKQVLALSRELGDQELVTRSFLLLARVAYSQGKLARAKSLAAQSLKLARRVHDEVRTVIALYTLGDVEVAMGDLTRAAAHSKEALAFARRTGRAGPAAYSLQNLARIALKRKNIAGAETYARQSLDLSRKVKARFMIRRSLEILTVTAAARGDYYFATRMLGAAAGLTEALGLQWPGDQIVSDRLVMTLRARLSETEFDAAWTVARQLTADEAVSEALQEHAGVTTSATLEPGNLTPREWQIAQLVARGHSNKSIAGRLFISPRTADTHVQHILNKLGVSSRAQIAAWAAGQSSSAVSARNT